MSKNYLKKDEDELQEYLQFRRRSSKVDAEKGRGSSYKRNRMKEAARKMKLEEKEDEEYN